MEIREIRAFDGPSIYSHRPVIKMRLDLGGYAETPTNELAGFTDRLLALLPGLAEHQCSRGYPGGFAERLREGTYLAHVTEHIALELQCLSGMTVHFGKARRTAIPGVYDIIVEYQSKHGALVATAAAVNIVKGLIRGGYIDLPQVIKKIKQAVTEYELGPSTAAIAAEAKKRGIPVTRIGTESILLLGYGKKQKWVQATTTEGCSCIAVDIAADKRLTKELLSDIGIPVPYGEIATTAEEAQAIAAQIGVPVVVKPYDGNQGKVWP